MTLASLAVRKTDAERLFEPLNLNFGAERTGLVGRNGCGKSSLLRAIGGEAVPVDGVISRTGTVWSLPQVTSIAMGTTLADALGVADALAILARILAGDGTEADLGNADWTLEERIEKALEGVGLGGVSTDAPLAQFSGGERTRAYLAAMTLAQPDVVLLDEPTNHLDTQGRERVLDLISAWPGCMIIASHDRAVLERVDRIVELSASGGRVYGGNYGLYQEQRALEREAAVATAQTTQKALDSLKREAQSGRERRERRESTGRKFGNSGSIPNILVGLRKSSAQSNAGREATVIAKRLAESETRAREAADALDRIQQMDIPLEPTGLSGGAEVLRLEQITVDLGNGPLFAPVDLHLRGPARVAITGPNGVGKSTLLGLLMGHIKAASGEAVISIKPVILDQDVSILRDDETVREAWLRLNPTGTVEDAQAALARFLFRNKAALKRVGDLSGGERVRAGLACVVAGNVPAKLLLLDEPTNHLDLDSIAAVEQVLVEYDGALLVVSHDGHFLDAIGIDQRLEISPSSR